jgi:orotate phosphoribosyltransferase
VIHYTTYAQLADDVRALVAKLPRDIVGVLGVARSGLIPATMVAEILHVPLGEASLFAQTGLFFPSGERLGGKHPTGGRLLVLDDSAYQGATLRRVWGAVSQSPFYKDYQWLWGAVYRHPDYPRTVDVFAREIPSQRYFQWNLMQHADMANWMMDIDGVLCFDGTVLDDDGPRYRRSLVDAIPLHLPRRQVHTLISMRLERWRPETEAWLEQHGVCYQRLILAPYPTAQKRRRECKYGEWKGQHYKDSPCTLFIESSIDQAPEIAKVSNKPVICLDTNQVFQG